MTSRRLIRMLVALLGFIVGVLSVVIGYFARRMVAPARQALWTSPHEMGLDYESVHFPAQDGVRLSGWFIPSPRNSRREGATIVLVHGWGWNRLGDSASDLLANFSGATPVELLRLAHALHYEGFHVLLFDLRNHGESAAQPPVTFGQQEAKDLLGAIEYLQDRPEVDRNRIGVIGFSMGANAVLYALPQTDQICAAVAVQPTTASLFAERFADDLMGAAGKLILPVVETIYSAVAGVSLAGFQPAFAVSGAAETPVLYLQAKHDQWGSVDDVRRMAAATPRGEGPLFVDGLHHYDGLQYLIENPKIAVTFFERYF